MQLLLSLACLLLWSSLALAMGVQSQSIIYNPGPSGVQPEGFAVLLKNASGSYDEVGRVPLNGQYVSPELQPGTYCYQVKPYLKETMGKESNEACVTLAAPTTLDGVTVIVFTIRAP